MGFTEQEFIAMQSRVQRALQKKPTMPADAATRETGKGGLHEQILNWCDSQWPKWKVIAARTDMRSTIASGAHDMTIFGPYPLCICVELKSKTGKLSEDQISWGAQMKALGWTVHVVRSLSEFEALTKTPAKPKPDGGPMRNLSDEA